MSQKEQILSIIESYIVKLNWSSTLEDIKERIINEVSDDDWIDVKNSLPDNSNDILMKWIFWFVTTAIWRYHKWEWFVQPSQIWWYKADVTHWKPLPLPPSK